LLGDERCVGRQNGLVPTVLVELPDGAGVVRRDDGDIVVTHDVSDDRGQLLRASDRYQPVNTWLRGDRSLVGGLLPPGAVSVEVIDEQGKRVAGRVGAGAYAAVLAQPVDHREPVVCCRDAAGTVVRRPLPDDYPSSPVTDAEEPCPACGAVDYEECVPKERWRGGHAGPDGPTIPSPIVVCRVCGHEEREGSIMRLSSPDDEDDAARAERIARGRVEQRVQQWYSHKLTLRAVTFPIYAVEGRPAQIGGSGSTGDELTALRIAHTETEDADLLDERPRIEVTTSTDEPYHDELAVARQKLEQWVHDEIDRPRSPDLSNAAITLWFRAADRRRRAAALAAIRSDAEITIDGTEQPFVVLTTPGGRWVAVRHHDDLTVTIAARDLDPATISVEPIADPAARLLGPEPQDR
jgi:hypothetical protein